MPTGKAGDLAITRGVRRILEGPLQSGYKPSWSNGHPRSTSTKSCKRIQRDQKQINSLPAQIQHLIKEEPEL